MRRFGPSFQVPRDASLIFRGKFRNRWCDWSPLAEEDIPHVTAIIRSPYDAILCALPEVTVVKTDLTPQLLCVVNPDQEHNHVTKTRKTLGPALSTIVNPVWRYKEILQHLRLKQTQLDVKN